MIKRFALEITGVLIGSASGWMYWKYIGCTSGSCPITSNPVHSTLYGAVMGVLLFSMFKKENK
ncbi:MAG: hypothetical protein JST43_08055 [Bacteroidetes bacterium]|nr:hypothetical protein [Bacteroidota bacterium]MBS1539199.1 hypothetical protein [Bacteroidota bacterium]